MSDVRTDPKAIAERIFVPGIDDGLHLAVQESIQPGRIRPLSTDFLSLASNTAQRLSAYETMWAKECWTQAVTFPTVLAVAENLTISRKEVKISGKVLLNSTGGSRYRTSIFQTDREAEAAITERLRRLSFENKGHIPVYEGEFRDLDYVVEAKNFFNYYHFLKETFPNLILYKKHGLRGRIIVAGRGNTVSGFVQSLCDTWFPEFKDRIEFDPSGEQRTFETALIGLNTTHMYFQTRNKVMRGIEDVGYQVARRASTPSLIAMSKNSCEVPLIELREHVMAKLGALPRSSRRLYIKRRSDRVRSVVGEDRLLDRLTALGFETVSFEDYDIEGQARLVAGAEALVTLHGAGLTNMLYAQPGCHVIELSNLQTLRKRYGDFNPLAIASGAHYCHAFVDHDFEDPERVPSIAHHGLRGVIMSDFQVDAIASWIASMVAPDQVRSARNECAALHKNGEMAALRERLGDHIGLLSHLPEAHIWMANALSEIGNDADALEALYRAVTLAPKKLALMKRALSLARKIKNNRMFHDLSIHARRYGGAEIRDFYAKHGWTFRDAEDQEHDIPPPPSTSGERPSA